MKIIIGLGNPGKKYERTRHNAGFMAVEEMAKRENLKWRLEKKFNAEIAEGLNVILVKPQTFMNNSGQTVSAILRYYKLLPKGFFGTKKDVDLSDVLLVIHDELDLPLGSYKISLGSGSAGHNGVQSIIDYVKTKKFKRLRLGITTAERKQIPGDAFVLQNFSPKEQTAITQTIAGVTREI